jgi:hypothetical protein
MPRSSEYQAANGGRAQIIPLPLNKTLQCYKNEKNQDSGSILYQI